MNKKTLQILADADNKLLNAEKSFLKTLPYDDGNVVTRHSGKYYDFGGVMSGINSVAKSVLDDSLDTTYDDLKRQKEYNNRSVLSGVSDNDALLMAMNSLQWGQEYKDKDFRDVSVWDDVSDTIMGGISGAMATKSPWGLLAAVPVAGNKIVNRLRARKERIKGNDDLTAFNSRLSNMFSATAQNVDTMNDRRLLESFYNSAAFGGDLNTHGADWDNGLTYINAGGTHESNPYDGVPAGTDENGVPNLVEEGEVIWDNQYVFSNRLKVPKKLLNKYKLGGPLTYADAIKKVTKESEERKNDPISNATTKAIVNEFIDSQEEVRMKKQQRAAERLQQAQYENELLNAIAGLSGEQAPMGPIDMQMPAQGISQEAPVIEQLGAFGGNLFAEGGYTVGRGKRLGEWKVVDSNGKTIAVYRNRIDAIARRDRENSNSSQKDKEKTAEQPQNQNPTETKAPAEQEKSKPDVKDDARMGKEQQRGQNSGSIKYDRSIDGKVFESQDYYQRFGRYLENSSDKEVKDWINKINADIKAQGDSYQIKSRKNLMDLAFDGKVGPVHQAFDKVAKNWANADASKKFNISEDENNYNSLVDKLEALGMDISGMPLYGYGHEDSYNEDGVMIPVAKEKKSEAVKDSKVITTKAGTTINSTKNPTQIKPGTTGTPVSGYNGVYDTGAGSYYDSNTGEYYSSLSDIDAVRNPSDAVLSPSIIIDSAKRQQIENSLKGTRGIEELNATVEDEVIPFEYKSTKGRNAPIYGAAAGALYGLLGSPNYSNADAILDAAERIGAPVSIPVETIGDYVQRRPFDERYLVNMANQNRAAASRSAANTAGGNRAMQLGADAFLAHSNQQELGEIMRQAYLANRQDELSTAEFNRGTNLQNMSAINQRNLSQAQLNSQRQQAMLSGLERGYSLRQQIKSDWDSATQQSLNSLYESLGNRGKEAEEYNTMVSMAQHGYSPYYYGNNGIIQFTPQGQYKAQPIDFWQPNGNLDFSVDYLGWKPRALGGNKKKRRF